ncbi:MAG: hypothetical protein IIC04_04060, partial [Proteobacteria bacterium]|nr:hypothetical protein [Pseudomonadota bacterium]
ATAIDALRPHCAGQLGVVFGAGGDRDPGKRPLMGEAVARRADVAIVTDDNPRGEDPAAIRAAVLAGCREAHEIGDRAAAILAGVDALKEPGDCLLIAGKGMDDKTAYDITKAMFEQIETFKDKSHRLIKKTATTKTLSQPGIVPFHPGAVKYMKEKGYMQ